MLSLVAYGDSDESGSEYEQLDEVPVPAKAVLVANDDSSTSGKEANTSSESGNHPAKVVKPTGTVATDGNKPLPLPSSQFTSIHFDLNILDKKRSQPIRITIPSLNDLGKEEEPVKKPKLKPSTKGSGLFSLLPEPKNIMSSVSKVLVPQSVAKTKKPQHDKPKPKKAKAKKTGSSFPDEDDEEGGEPLSSFFFSASDDVPLPPIDIPMIPSEVATQNFISQTSGNDGLDCRVQLHNDVPSSIEVSQQSHMSEIEEASLDSAALLKLCGARGRKKGPDLSDIIEVSGSSLVGDTSLQLAKELSKEQPTHSFKRKSECSSTQRRKHQITYLAEQAKAQELELRNNWAQNRMTRKQTQAKYGF